MHYIFLFTQSHKVRFMKTCCMCSYLSNVQPDEKKTPYAMTMEKSKISLWARDLFQLRLNSCFRFQKFSFDLVNSEYSFTSSISVDTR